MKRISAIFIITVVSFLLFSCQSLRVINVEVFNPSSITFPREVKTVMIIDNSAQQPDIMGHRFVSDSEKDSVLSVSADSTAYLFCMSLGKAIAESPIFYDVRICEDTIRTDSLFFESNIFSPNEVNSICFDYGVDALISLDKIFFSSVYNEHKLRSYSFIYDNTVGVDVSGELRVFWPGQKEVFVFHIDDSIKWYLVDPFVSNETAFPAAEVRSAMKSLSETSGWKMHYNIVPHWSEDKRWYYLNMLSSEWKQGTAFFVAEKWEEANDIWVSLFGKSKKWKQKAQLASNIALCYEMSGDFEKAIEYAGISYGFYKENSDENNYYTKLQLSLITVLKERMKNDEKLSRQLSE